jgi:hypothetical protein
MSSFELELLAKPPNDHGKHKEGEEIQRIVNSKSTKKESRESDKQN